MSKVAQIEAELGNLSQAELREVRDLLDDLIEDDLEFTSEFESSVKQSEREMKQGLRPSHSAGVISLQDEHGCRN